MPAHDTFNSHALDHCARLLMPNEPNCYSPRDPALRLHRNFLMKFKESTADGFTGAIITCYGYGLIRIKPYWLNELGC